MNTKTWSGIDIAVCQKTPTKEEVDLLLSIADAITFTRCDLSLCKDVDFSNEKITINLCATNDVRNWGAISENN